jgi:hypothetical protein
MKKINIGITVLIKEPTESLFTNGIKQNAISIRETLKEVGTVNEVYYINLGKQKDYSQSPWGKYSDYIINFEDSLNKIDLIVCVCAGLPEDYAKIAHKKGIKLVHHIMGNEYYAFSESVVFKEEKESIIQREKYYDQVWISPHLFESNKDLFEILYDCPAYVGPYVWTPAFLEGHVEGLKKKDGVLGVYRPSGKKEKRISVFEPNISMVKNCITPIIASEKAFKKNASLIDSVNLFGASVLKKKKILVDFVKNLEIYKNNKIFFEDRYPIAWSLFKHTDIVFSHQLDCGLNYLYLDAAWLGYPVVHNSPYMKELGLYYPDHDAEVAARNIISFAETFDDVYENYYNSSREYAKRYFPTHPDNVSGYKKLIQGLGL